MTIITVIRIQFFSVPYRQPLINTYNFLLVTTVLIQITVHIAVIIISTVNDKLSNDDRDILAKEIELKAPKLTNTQ